MACNNKNNHDYLKNIPSIPICLTRKMQGGEPLNRVEKEEVDSVIKLATGEIRRKKYGIKSFGDSC